MPLYGRYDDGNDYDMSQYLGRVEREPSQEEIVAREHQRQVDKCYADNEPLKPSREEREALAAWDQHPYSLRIRYTDEVEAFGKMLKACAKYDAHLRTK